VAHWSFDEEGMVRSSLSVYLELMTILGAYRDELILVGGWAPYFLLEAFGDPDRDFRHVGSLDIDLAVDHRRVGPDEYASIVERVERHGYRQRRNSSGGRIPFSLEREVIGEDGRSHTVHVDFLAAEYGGTGRGHRHQRVQHGLLARKSRGCDVVFDHWFTHELRGLLPDGVENVVKARVADLVGCVCMKGITLGERRHNKDAYDIYSVVAYYDGGPLAAAQTVKPYRDVGLVREALSVVEEKFQSIRSLGPTGVASFLSTDPAERERLMADAYVALRAFIEAVGS